MNDFDKTPSFYNNEEAFLKYLGRTSYYLALQKAVTKIVKLVHPSTILELGSGTGTTANLVAKENNDSYLVAVDMREDMVNIGQQNAEKNGSNNISFITEDMVKYVKKIDKMPDLTYFLYSFHHITDPRENKVEFLKICFDKMKKGSRICIAETFLTENTGEIQLQAELKKLWALRSYEGYASTFWDSLESLHINDINTAREIGHFSYDNEWKAGELVSRRDNEFLIELNWLCKVSKEIGFEIELAEPCNVLNDYLVLLRKSGISDGK